MTLRVLLKPTKAGKFRVNNLTLTCKLPLSCITADSGETGVQRAVWIIILRVWILPEPQQLGEQDRCLSRSFFLMREMAFPFHDHAEHGFSSACLCFFPWLTVRPEYHTSSFQEREM